MPKKKDHGYTKQHIVPRAYLNGFATPGKGKDKYMIGVRQKKTSSIIPLRRIMSATYRTTMTLISLMTRNNGNTTLLTK